MPISADVLADIQNSTLENFIDKGTVWKQNISNKPMLKDFNAKAGQFGGGRENVSFAVKDGSSRTPLQGYTGDDQVTYYDPAGIKRARFPWREHHIGIVLTHTELKTDGIDVNEATGADQSTSQMDDREKFALANRLDEVMDDMAESFSWSLDRLIHGDGTTDTKALAGVQSLILDAPAVGSTGSISRVANTWWRNRAATAANGAAGGQGPIVSSPTGGGALMAFLEKESLQLKRYVNSSPDLRLYVGSDFRAAYMAEIRANGTYTMTGYTKDGVTDGKMSDPMWNGLPLVYDPTLDDLGMSKRMYAIDMSRGGLRVLYMDGNRLKRHKPARPYDRYVMYNGITTTAVMIAKRLNSSAVYDIA